MNSPDLKDKKGVNFSTKRKLKHSNKLKEFFRMLTKKQVSFKKTMKQQKLSNCNVLIKNGTKNRSMP